VKKVGKINLFIILPYWYYLEPEEKFELKNIYFISQVTKKMILFITTAVKTSNPTSSVLLEEFYLLGYNAV
jgi:hypothetical protein